MAWAFWLWGLRSFLFNILWFWDLSEKFRVLLFSLNFRGLKKIRYTKHSLNKWPGFGRLRDWHVLRYFPIDPNGGF